jgi:response regulator of citrate/malate metabolism
MKLGAFDYLMKPIDLEPLLEKLSDANEKKRLHQAKIEQAEIRRNMSMPS